MPEFMGSLEDKMTSLNDLKNLRPKKNFFVALDSDGTIFDSMNQKHKNCLFSH